MPQVQAVMSSGFDGRTVMEDKSMNQVIAVLERCPGVRIVAVLDHTGACLETHTVWRPEAANETIDLRSMFDELHRRNPAWTSASLRLGKDHLLGRRHLDHIILVLAEPLAAAEVERTLEAAITGTQPAVGNGTVTDPLVRVYTEPLAEEDVLWLRDTEDEDLASSSMLEELLAGDTLRTGSVRVSLSSGLPHAIAIDSERTEKTELRVHEPVMYQPSSDSDRQGELERHLELARWVQTCLLPDHNIIEHPFIDIAGQFHPADTCSGDWWAVDTLPDDRLLFVIGDVTGHGIGPAMITAIVRGAYDVTLTHLGADMSCEQLLRSLNTSVYRAAHQSLLMTCAACIFDPRSRTMSIANAGHNFPLLVRQANNKVNIREIVNSGSPLGSATSLDLSTVVVPLERDDVIFWYTDGLIDCENEQTEQFGRRRLVRALRRQTVQEPAVICDTIRHMFAHFRGNQPQNDDVTFVAARIK